MVRFGHVSVMLAVVLALGVEHETANSKSGDSVKKPPPAAAAGAAQDTPQVTLTDPGSEPRSVLRFKPVANSTQNIVAVLRMGVEMEVDGMKLPTPKMPGARFEIQLTVASVNRVGTATCNIKIVAATSIDEPGAPPEVVKRMRDDLDQLAGLVGKGDVTNRGFVRAAKFEVPAGASDELVDTLESLQEGFQRAVLQLPLEPVGAGAKWSVVENEEVDQIKVQYTVNYELTERKDSALKLRSTIVGDAEPRTLSGPEFDEPMQLTELRIRGTGSEERDLTKVVATTSSTSVTYQMKMQPKDAKAGGTMSISGSMDLDIRAR
jgi:hypothetical protein